MHRVKPWVGWVLGSALAGCASDPPVAPDGGDAQRRQLAEAGRRLARGQCGVNRRAGKGGLAYVQPGLLHQHQRTCVVMILQSGFARSGDDHGVVRVDAQLGARQVGGQAA